MARLEMDYSKHTHVRWTIKWRLEHLGALRIIDETALLILTCIVGPVVYSFHSDI